MIAAVYRLYTACDVSSMGHTQTLTKVCSPILSSCSPNPVAVPPLTPPHTGHIMLNRVDRRSQLKCLQSCIEMLGAGASVLFFPEGTRSKDKVLGGFKKGAFSVAVKAGVPVVPITLIGTGEKGERGGVFWVGRVVWVGWGEGLQVCTLTTGWCSAH